MTEEDLSEMKVQRVLKLGLSLLTQQEGVGLVEGVGLASAKVEYEKN